MDDMYYISSKDCGCCPSVYGRCGYWYGGPQVPYLPPKLAPMQREDTKIRRLYGKSCIRKKPNSYGRGYSYVAGVISRIDLCSHHRF